MTTAVSIALYAASVFFAATLGLTSQQYRDGKAEKSQAVFAVVFTVGPFLLAAILQVFA